MNLETGDVVYFSPVGPQVAVVGRVNVPAIYELREHESIAEALALAGGVSAAAETSTLEVERTQKQSEGATARVAIDVQMNATSMAAPMRNADIEKRQRHVCRDDEEPLG